MEKVVLKVVLGAAVSACLLKGVGAVVPGEQLFEVLGWAPSIMLLPSVVVGAMLSIWQWRLIERG